MTNDLLNTELEQRKEKLLSLMHSKGLDGILLSSSAQIDQRGNLRYFIDYYVAVYEEYLLLTKEGEYIFFAHDGLSSMTAKKVSLVNESVVIPNYSQAGHCIAEVLRELRIINLGIASLRSINAETLMQIQEHTPTLEITDLYSDIMQMRKIKSVYEFERIREAIAINDSCFEFFFDSLQIGVKDVEALRDAQKKGEELGTEDQYWMMSSGTIPKNNYHALVKRSPRVLRLGDYITVVLEHSSHFGYWGETYNVISIGEPRKDIADAYNCLAKIHEEIRDLLLPGKKVHEVASYVQNRLVQEGYRKARKDGEPYQAIGHGQGLDAFEPPVIIEGSDELLEANTQVNIHPSIVLSDGTSLSLCFCYFIRESHAECLTRLSNKIYQL